MQCFYYNTSYCYCDNTRYVVTNHKNSLYIQVTVALPSSSHSFFFSLARFTDVQPYCFEPGARRELWTLGRWWKYNILRRDQLNVMLKELTNIDSWAKKENEKFSDEVTLELESSTVPSRSHHICLWKQIAIYWGFSAVLCGWVTWAAVNGD